MAAIAETYRRPDLGGVCVADGFGVRIVVERGASKSTMASVRTAGPVATTGPPMGSAGS
jgi:hypothetical protein